MPRRTTSLAALLVLLSLALPGCGGPSRRTAAATRAVSGPLDESTTALLAAFPSNVGQLVIIRADRWTEARTTLERLVAPQLPEVKRKFATLLDDGHPLDTLARLAGLPSSGWEDVARLVDASRPILLAPLLGDLTAIERYLEAGAVSPATETPVGWHSRAVLPTADPAALAAALTARLPSGDPAVRWVVVPEAAAVRVERIAVLRPDVSPDRLKAALAAARRGAGQSGPRLGARRTAALTHALRSGGVVSAWLDLDAIRSIATLHGLSSIWKAMEALPTPEEATALLGRPVEMPDVWEAATGVLAKAWWMLGGYTRGVEDVAVVIELGGGQADVPGGALALELVASLTTAGRATLEAATDDVPAAPGPAWTDAAFTLAIDADLAAATRAAPLPLWAICAADLEIYGAARGSASSLLLECGPACWVEALIAGPWSLLRGLHEVFPGEPGTDVLPHLPRALRIEARPHDGRMAVAAGALLAADYDTAPLERLTRSDLVLRNLALASRPTAGGTAVVATLGGDPNAAFAPDGAAPPAGAIAALAIDPSALARGLSEDMPDLRDFANGFGALRARLVPVGDTLVLQAALAPAKAPAPVLPPPPRFDGVVGPSALPDPWPPEGAVRCLLCAPSITAMLAGSSAGVDPDKRGEFVERVVLDEAARLGRCVTGADEWAALANRRVAAIAHGQAWAAMTRGDASLAARLLQIACDAGDRAGCASRPAPPSPAMAPAKAKQPRPVATPVVPDPAR